MFGLARKTTKKSRFIRDDSGAIALMFAFAILPLFGLVGAAIDYTTALNTKTKVQTALDSAALAGARLWTGDDADRLAEAAKFFDYNFHASNGATVTPVFEIVDGNMVGTATYNQPTSLLKVVGLSNIRLKTQVVVPLLTAGKAEIVLVLDYSSSMLSNSKYIRMRDAATELVEHIADNSKHGDVKFGLVPFAGLVYTDLQKEFVKGQTGSGTWTGCTQDRRHPYNQQASAPNPSLEQTKWGEAKGSSFAVDYRNGDYTVKSNVCSAYPANSLKITPLTDDDNAITSQLRAMVPAFGTHIALGVEFGWHLLSPEEPFSNTVPYRDEDTKKVIVILTDGRQTAYGWGPNDTIGTDKADDNTLHMCQQMKANDIMVFTIGYDLNDSHTTNLLRDCADNGRFFEADGNGASIAAVFKAIGQQIQETMLRLAK